ncbi:eae-like domain protein [Salmonella enterica subsp. enterica serovar Havana]
MKERGITDGLTMNQLAERNAEYVMTIAELEEKCAAMTAKLSMINDLMEAAEQANKLAQEATETLVQERNALAAENAGLKAVCDDRRTFIMNGVQLGYIEVPTVETDPALETIRIAVSPQEPTPATDAFLAEVRAQGADELAELYFTLAAHEANRYIADSWRESARFAKDYAVQIRKGAAQ